MNVWLFDALSLIKPGQKYRSRVGRHCLEVRLPEASSEFPLIELDETNVLLEDWIESPHAESEFSPPDQVATAGPTH